MTEICGWEMLCECRLDEDVERVWGVDSGSAGRIAAVIRSPGSDRGMMRIAEGPDRQAASGFQRGWSGIEIVVSHELDALCHRLDAHSAFDLWKPVNKADFTHAEANVHDFFLGQIPGGTYIMFTMAVTEPVGYEFPKTPNQVGHIFDVHLNLDKLGLSRHFYQDVLGMDKVFDDILRDGIFYETWDLDASAPDVQMSILKGNAPGFGWGGIEIRYFDASLLAPPTADRRVLGGGCSMATFLTENMDAAFCAVRDHPAATVLAEPVRLKAEPYGDGLVFAFISPDGERVEVVEHWAV
jgi:catechol 2,3-dioxygenase-like lactoylglutathione lyase family enzyme